jgi:hypothetical protein
MTCVLCASVGCKAEFVDKWEMFELINIYNYISKVNIMMVDSRANERLSIATDEPSKQLSEQSYHSI